MRALEIILACVIIIVFISSCTAQQKPEPLVRKDLKTSTVSSINVGDTYYFSGITGRDPETGEYPEGVSAQTKMIMDKFKVALEELGLNWNNVVKVDVYITDMADKPKMNDVYFSYFEGYKRPCRVCVGTGLEGDAVVEIAMIAVKTAE